MLELGGVDADTAVTVSNIDVEKNMPVDQDVTPEGFAYPTFTPGGTDYNSFDLYVHENAGAALTGDGTSATATVTTPADGWQVKLYAKPGLTLEAGESYKVTMDVANADGCKACFPHRRECRRARGRAGGRQGGRGHRGHREQPQD